MFSDCFIFFIHETQNLSQNMILYMPKYDAEFKTQNRQETCQTQKDEKQYSQNNK